MDTINESLIRTNKLYIIDEITKSGIIGATIGAVIAEKIFDLMDAPIRRLCMSDAPVPYAETMEKGVVKRKEDLTKGILT